MKEILLILGLLFGSAAVGKAFNVAVMQTRDNVSRVILGMGGR